MKKSGFAILAAVNSSALIPAVAETPIEAAANARVVEGRMTVPYGLWPVTITNEKGEPEKVLQRLNRQVAERLVAAFNSLRGRLSRFVSGSAIYLGHPDHAGAKNPAAWNRLGKCVGMTAGEAALEVAGDFDEAGKTLLAANEALAPSPHWGLRRTGETQDGLAICEPVAFYTMGITPRPNIAGAAINEDPGAQGGTDVLVADASRDQQMAILGADIAQLEMDLASARDALAVAQGALQARSDEVAALTTTLAEKTARCQGLEADMAAIRAEFDACRTALEASKAEAAGYDAAINAVVDGAVECGSVIAADREHWRGKLRTTPAAVNELFATARTLKTSSVVSAGRMAAANEAMGGTSAAARFEQAVRERMAKTGDKWTEAWNACRETHKELFNLMPNGGKA